MPVVEALETTGILYFYNSRIGRPLFENCTFIQSQPSVAYRVCTWHKLAQAFYSSIAPLSGRNLRLLTEFVHGTNSHRLFYSKMAPLSGRNLRLLTEFCIRKTRTDISYSRIAPLSAELTNFA